MLLLFVYLFVVVVVVAFSFFSSFGPNLLPLLFRNEEKPCLVLSTTGIGIPPHKNEREDG